MLATIAICTLNRAESLARILESLTAIEIPTGVEWEILVVNSGSTDHTDHVTRSFGDRHEKKCPHLAQADMGAMAISRKRPAPNFPV